MVGQLLLLILLFEIVAFHPYNASAVFIDNVETADWTGVAFYISVKREAIQNKLDDYHSSVSNECGEGPRLFVPEESVLPDMHNNDRHPVYIDFGFMLRSQDFYQQLENNPCRSVSTAGLEVEVSVAIPFLAGTPDGPPIYALALTKFYKKSSCYIEFPKAYSLYPYIPVDEITLNDYGAFIRNGSDEMRISFNRLSHPCEPPTSIVKEKFEELVFSNFRFGLPTPGYSVCDRHSFVSQGGPHAERIKCGVNRNDYTPNICRMWLSKGAEACAMTVKIENITSGFRDFILLGDDTINILASENARGSASMALRIPCQGCN